MKFGEFVKQYRKEHDMSQRTFAKICGVSNGYISMIEKGENPKTHEPIKPSLEMLHTISSGIGITMHELLSQIDDIDVDISGQRKMPAPESGLSEARRALLNAIDGMSEEEIFHLIDVIAAVKGMRK